MKRRARISIPIVAVLAAGAALVGREAGAQFVAPQLTPQLGGNTVSPQVPVQTRPTISTVTSACGLATYEPASIRGTGFGTAANGRKVKFVTSSSGTTYLGVARWTDTEITIVFRDGTAGTLGLSDSGGGWVSNFVPVRLAALRPGSDRDGDSFDSASAGGTDCDDCDARRYPHNTEICDPAGRDEDCDPTTYGSRDSDGDRQIDALCFNEFDGRRYSGNDCNDSRSDIHPILPEVCNGWDDNCDGVIDDPIGRVLYRDGDGDGAGDPRTQQRACGGLRGYVELPGDCNDADPAVGPGRGCPAACR
jgi:hypothetical protein